MVDCQFFDFNKFMEEDLKKNQIAWLVDSRKLLHYLMNEEELKNKPLLVIINVNYRIVCFELTPKEQEHDVVKGEQQ